MKAGLQKQQAPSPLVIWAGILTLFLFGSLELTRGFGYQSLFYRAWKGIALGSIIIAYAGGWSYVFTARHIAQRTRKYRREHGLCLKCGDDLKATPRQCPECGTAP
jgi:hypothetical protein